MTFRATIERALSPGIGYCYRCERPWKIAKLKRIGPRRWQQQNRLRYWGLVGVESHSTFYTEDSACFPLCENCWSALTPHQRLPHYERLYALWEAQSRPGDEIEPFGPIREAVLAGR